MTTGSPRYSLRVAAGPDYDPATHQEVFVNSDKNLTIENDHGTVNLCVRIQDFIGVALFLEDFQPSR